MSVNARQTFPKMALPQMAIPQQLGEPQDARMRAIDQYMQMRGAQLPPNLPQQMSNSQGGVRPMTLPENQQAIEDMSAGQTEAYPNDTNAYFRDELDSDTDLIDQERSADDQMQDELNTAEDRVPTYVTNKGQPSPDEQYTDEDLLRQLAEMLDKQRK